MDPALKILKRRQENVFDSLASLLGGLASPVRIRLVHFLSQAPLTVEVLAAKAEQSMANTSMHLRKMHAEGLVTVESLGQKRLYSLAPAVQDFWERCQDFAQQINPSLVLHTADVYGDINWKLPWDETRELVWSGKIVLVDVRPADELITSEESEHVLRIPQGELKSHLKMISKRKSVLVLCRGRLCALSAFAVNYLREKGYKAYRLEGSWNSIKADLIEEKRHG